MGVGAWENLITLGTDVLSKKAMRSTRSVCLRCFSWKVAELSRLAVLWARVVQHAPRGTPTAVPAARMSLQPCPVALMMDLTTLGSPTSRVGNCCCCLVGEVWWDFCCFFDTLDFGVVFAAVEASLGVGDGFDCCCLDGDGADALAVVVVFFMAEGVVEERTMERRRALLARSSSKRRSNF